MTATDAGRLAKRAGWDVVGLVQGGVEVLLCWRAYDGFKLVQVGPRSSACGGLKAAVYSVVMRVYLVF